LRRPHFFTQMPRDLFEDPIQQVIPKKEVGSFEDENPEQESIELEKIFSSGDYWMIRKEMQSKGLLAGRIEKARNDCENSLEKATFLEEKDWEMLAILKVYDQSTFEHCLATYRIAKEKVEKPLVNEKGDFIVLSEKMKQEGVSLDQFYRTCLLHDIGKVEIPRTILNNSIDEENWNSILDQMIARGDTDTIIKKMNKLTGRKNSPEEIRVSMKNNNIRAISLVPLSEILSPEELEDLESKGFSGDDSLGDVMKRHELSSRRILEGTGFVTEGELAGQHHNYQKEEIKRKITVDNLRLSAEMSDILRLADVEQALESKRPYREELPKMTVLTILIQQSESGMIGRDITKLWIRDELSNVEEEYKVCIKSRDALSFQESENNKCKDAFVIKKFLESN